MKYFEPLLLQRDKKPMQAVTHHWDQLFLIQTSIIYLGQQQHKAVSFSAIGSLFKPEIEAEKSF